MNEPDELTDRTLDDLLRKGFKGEVADDGFSTRVMRALPPRRRQRPWLLPGAALAGGLLAWLAVLPAQAWQDIAREWLAGDVGPVTVGTGMLLLVVSMLGCAWALDEA
ncbi:MAG: DUF5056 domain-containing protein [Xanthomonadales bacterium]|nr:DUF5056 domain-containing protein [Xanthomonadales bacterium]